MATQITLPEDAEGREIPLDTECPYTCNGEKPADPIDPEGGGDDYR